MKSINIKFIAIALILIYIITMHTIVLASATDSFYTEYYKPPKITEEEAQQAISITGKTLGLLRNIGVIISVVSISIIGLKYMFASLDERAKYKETLLPWVFGIFLLVFSGTMVSYMYDMATKEGPTAQSAATSVSSLSELENYLNTYGTGAIWNLSDGQITQLYNLYHNAHVHMLAELSEANGEILDQAYNCIQNGVRPW